MPIAVRASGRPVEHAVLRLQVPAQIHYYAARRSVIGELRRLIERGSTRGVSFIERENSPAERPSRRATYGQVYSREEPLSVLADLAPRLRGEREVEMAPRDAVRPVSSERRKWRFAWIMSVLGLALAAFVSATTPLTGISLWLIVAGAVLLAISAIMNLARDLRAGRTASTESS